MRTTNGCVTENEWSRANGSAAEVHEATEQGVYKKLSEHSLSQFSLNKERRCTISFLAGTLPLSGISTRDFLSSPHSLHDDISTSKKL
jgi:hypothetical protein